METIEEIADRTGGLAIDDEPIEPCPGCNDPECDFDCDRADEPAICERCGNSDNDGSDECPDCGDEMA